MKMLKINIYVAVLFLAVMAPVAVFGGNGYFSSETATPITMAGWN
jgi:hypothetical protein